ncbi:MAG: VWA domain-containing protein [Burkholderiaceae bacterium]
MNWLSTIEFLSPAAFLLLPLPLLVWRWSANPQASNSLIAPERILSFLRRLDPPGRLQIKHARLKFLLALLGWISLVVALSGPTGNKTALPGATGRDLLVVLDLSASMRARDVQLGDDLVSRVEAVKAVAGQFIRGRDGDRVGLIVFANEPFLIAPLTYDVAAVSKFLDEVAVGLPGRKTAIGDALTLGVQQLSLNADSAKVVLLLTDGASNAGTNAPLQAAQTAANHQIRIHTIGFGGHLNINNKTSGNQLEKIATATGGRYFAAPSAQALREVYATLDTLEPTASELAVKFIRRDYTPLAAGAALCLLLLISMLDWRAGRL